MRRSQGWQALGKNLARAIGVATKEAANINVQADDLAVPRQVGQFAGIATMHTFGLMTTQGAAACLAVGDHADMNRLVGNGDLLKGHVIGQQPQADWESLIRVTCTSQLQGKEFVAHPSRIREPEVFSCPSFEPKVGLSPTL